MTRSPLCRQLLPLFLFCTLTGIGRADASADVFAAIKGNDIDALRAAIAAEPTAATAASQRGVTPLSYAVVQHRLEAAYELLEAGADPNDASGRSNITVLHRAADKGFADMVRLLLENKADPRIAAANGFTALHLAARTNSQECVALLLKAGAELEATDANGRTALHIAATHDSADAAQALIEAGASLTAVDNFGYTPASLATDPKLVAKLGSVPKQTVPESAPTTAAETTPPTAAETAPPTAAETALPAAVETAPAIVVASVSDSSSAATETAPAETVKADSLQIASSWPENPFHDQTLDPASKIRKFHADSGTTLLPDGRSYWGGMQRGRFEGFGVLLAENERDRYEGSFHRGRKNGFGAFYYANGDVFSGEFRDDAPNGEGEFSFAGGGVVKGVWKRGRFWQGRGSFTAAGGAKFTGVWDNGELVASRPID